MGTDYRARNAAAPEAESWWGDPRADSYSSRQKRPRPRAQHLPEEIKRRSSRGATQRFRAQALNRVLMYMTLGLLVFCLFMQINRYAHIASQSKEILSLVSQIEKLENDQANLNFRLAARENLAYVRDEAMYNLGMSYPAEGQVRVVALAGGNQVPTQQTAANSADSAQ